MQGRLSGTSRDGRQPLRNPFFCCRAAYAAARGTDISISRPVHPLLLNSMHRMIRSLLCVCAVLLLLAVPAAASQVLTGESVTPNPPLFPGGLQHVVAEYTIIPSGSATFPAGHNLQMETDLTDAQWTVQVIVDGNNAARQTASGSAAFVNGVILSYPTNHDVSFTVTIGGAVPATATGNVTLLRMLEIDNTGTPVPGSRGVIARPVAGVSVSAGQTAGPPLTPAPVTTPSPAAKSPGFSAIAGIAGSCLAGIVSLRHRQ